jgi:hypothetical protein
MMFALGLLLLFFAVPGQEMGSDPNSCANCATKVSDPNSAQLGPNSAQLPAGRAR